MSELTKRAAYLKGLADGMKLDKEKDEAKLLAEIIDFLADVADQVDAIDDEQGFIADALDEMEEDIKNLKIAYSFSNPDLIEGMLSWFYGTWYDYNNVTATDVAALKGNADGESYATIVFADTDDATVVEIYFQGAID